MKKVVITGSSKGIGFGLATNFLKRGHQVVIVGSTYESTNKAYEKLNQQFIGNVFAQSCDVRDYHQVQHLLEEAIQLMGGVDIWVNNAGITQPSEPSYKVSQDDIKRIIDINIQGVIHGSKVALEYFYKVKKGALYNMEGLGSDGRIAPYMAYYGGTKRFLRYYSIALAKENKEKSVIVGRLSPGMVTTELLLKDLDLSNPEDKTLKLFRILADKVETVTPYLCDGMLSNTKNNKLIAWLTTPKILLRFLSAPFSKRNPFS